MKHKATKIEKGEYEYRGFEIVKTDTSTGYFGAWRVYCGRHIFAETLKNAKMQIDKELER